MGPVLRAGTKKLFLFNDLQKLPLSFFLSWVVKTPLNHWTKWVVRTQLMT